jgi:hypothetical protein
MSAVFNEYAKDRVGWFFGLTGPQLAVVVAAGLPVLGAFNTKQWTLLGGLSASWVLVFVLVVVPVRGRPATGWAWACVMFAVGTLLGWTAWRSKASRGAIDDLGEPDLPGVLSATAIHDGPPVGVYQRRIALIQHHASRTWAVTAALTHAGITTADAAERDRLAQGLSELLDAGSRTGLISEVLFLVRTVPENGATRSQYLTDHRRPGSLPVVQAINNDLAVSLTRAAVKTEAFVTLIVDEARLARAAKETGGGLDGRGRALYLLMSEVETHLRGSVEMTEVRWLTSPELAAAVRTGFAPGDADSITAAVLAHEKDAGVNGEVPWAMAGPSGADSAMRHYSHDAWNSISATIKLPDKGAIMGALAPVLMPSEPGERRSLLVAYPVLDQTRAERQANSAQFGADMSEALREKAGVRSNARGRRQIARTRRMDENLAQGNAMVRPYAICTVTVPKTVRVAEYGRRLDAAVRQAGFAPMRLDLVQDAAFAASSVPLGVSLTHTRDA